MKLNQLEQFERRLLGIRIKEVSNPKVFEKMKSQEQKQEIELKPCAIKCKKCHEESPINYWSVGVEDSELVRLCPLCHEKEIVL